MKKKFWRNEKYRRRMEETKERWIVYRTVVVCHDIVNKRKRIFEFELQPKLERRYEEREMIRYE